MSTSKIDIREYISPVGLVLIECHCLAVVPQSGAKQSFYCTVNYITLNSACEAEKASKHLKRIVEDRVGSQK
jgi:hypothetical protein